MTAQGGYGVTFQLNGTVMVGVDDIDELSFIKFMAEVTAHDSPGGYYEAVDTGKRRIEPMNITVFWDTNNAVHQAMVDTFATRDAQEITWADPDGDETIVFQAYIEKIGRVSPQDEGYRANVIVHPTGTATIS